MSIVRTYIIHCNNYVYCQNIYNLFVQALETGRKENIWSESKYTKDTSKELSSKNDPTIASLCPLMEYTTRLVKC